MGWFMFVLLLVIVLVSAGYRRSNAETFFYLGPDEEKYKKAFIAILTAW